MRIECPNCKTSYTAERLGITLGPQQSAQLDVACVLCKAPFHVEINPKVVATTPGWWARTVLRRKPELTLDGHEVR